MKKIEYELRVLRVWATAASEMAARHKMCLRVLPPFNVSHTEEVEAIRGIAEKVGAAN